MAMMVTMLKAIELPARVADLTTCLANVDRDTPEGNFQLRIRDVCERKLDDLLAHGSEGEVV